MATPARADAPPPVREFLTLTNAARARVGAPPLALDGQLASVAERWATRLGAVGRLAHNPNVTSECKDWERLAENVGVGPDVASIERAFENSPVHYANIVDPQLQRVGIGVVAVNRSLWVTLDFARPTTAALPPVVAAPKPPRGLAATATPAPAPLKPAPKPRPARELRVATPATPPATPASPPATGQASAGMPARRPPYAGVATLAVVLLTAAARAYRIATRTVLARPSGTTMRNRPLRLTGMRCVFVPDGESTRTVALDRLR
jgi:hypothetical protein